MSRIFNLAKIRKFSTSVMSPKRPGITRIIAVGDSLTFGKWTTNPALNSWPAQLENMLNDKTKYEVFNLGVNGRTAMKCGDNPYWKEPQYQEAMHSEADIAFLMLGTNDAKTYQWNADEYNKDYLELAGNLKSLTPNTKLYLMGPPPLYQDGAY